MNSNQFSNDMAILEDALKVDPTKPYIVFMLASLINKLNIRLEKVEGVLNTPSTPTNSSRGGDVSRKYYHQKRVSQDVIMTKRSNDEFPSFTPPITPTSILQLDAPINTSPVPIPLKQPPFISKSQSDSAQSPKWIPRKPQSEGVKELADIENYKATLRTWTEKKVFKVIYNSNKDGLTCESLNKRVVGLKNVMIFVFDSDNNIFGGFTNKSIPQCAFEDHEYVTDDDKFFVFSLNNKKGVYPIKMERKKGDLGFRISNDNDNVFGIADCFSIVANDKSYIIPTFNKYYNDSTGIGAELFTGNTYPERFKVSYMIAVQWS